MAVVMIFSWPEITPDVYDAVRQEVRWEEDTPDGCVPHAAWFVNGGLNVMDIWESQDHFNRFIEARIAPVLKGELGVQSDPEPKFYPLHRRFVALASAAPAPDARLPRQGPRQLRTETRMSPQAGRRAPFRPDAP
ncbi:hypothetical protein [Streptomyces nojiriensis]|uniref:hypothetical protein n=1 Tax=Streptomyces nojiriensis TaxID=66374 RepID=UPI001672D6E1|nr:hypothetical protein [Streptomyces nojiriensis]QTI42300.1 hypothetical protein JYK04_00057 [Streptomyces nojiriensis]GGS34651.1 hypothetical protein GCM10010205_76050 [Streptomyces nojiriensis]